MRQKLFGRVPNAKTTWHRCRKEYVASIASLEGVGQLVMARKHALRALQFLPESDAKAALPHPRSPHKMSCAHQLAARFLVVVRFLALLTPSGRPPHVELQFQTGKGRGGLQRDDNGRTEACVYWTSPGDVPTAAAAPRGGGYLCLLRGGGTGGAHGC